MLIKSVKFNFFMNMLLTVSNVLFPLITFPYVSRVLSPVGTGKVAFAYSIVSYFSIFAAFGVANYGIRACAQVRDNKEKLSKTVQEILCINIVLMSFVYFVYFLSVAFIPELKAEKTLFLISGLNILFAIVGVEWLYKGIEQYSYITIRSIIFKFIAFFLVFACVKTEADYSVYAFIIIFATVGSGIVNLYNLRKIIIIKRFENYDFKSHLKPMMTFFITTIAVAFYVNVSVALLGFIQGNEEVGYYNAAYRIKDVMVSIITSLGAVLLPRLSYYIENNMQDKFNEIVSKSTQFIFILSIPLVIFCILFAKPSVLILAGSAYSGSIVPLQVLALIIFIVGLSNLTGIQMLIPLKKEQYLCYSVVIAAVINMVFNLILIPQYGAIGVAVSVVVAEVSILIYQIYILRSYFQVLFGSISYIKVMLAVTFATSLSMWLNIYLHYNEIIVFLVSASLFFICYFGVLLLSKEPFIFSILNQIKSKLIKN
ncbi:oligosaccharide flippase family protein [Actinobacillus equuli subsp. equuli]|uniref:oligosaccharide flippase family protein n=2 Tax=Actinobacillus equuli TaxID=718 RepID=UPI0024431F09|nr:oligosaccharide flippase family protein [Actinobacillus equuli]WGE65247.1 oligosaccharide flippase family protein [Actinobacillus equuli subsp. equuli]